MLRRGRITFDDWSGGWARSPLGSAAPVEGAANQFSNSAVISFRRPNRLGHAAPGELFTALTDGGGLVNELPLNGVAGSNGEAFCILRSARLVRFTALTNVISTSYDVAMVGTHAAHTLTTSDNADEIIVKDRAATPGEYVIRFYEDNTDADAGIIKTDGTAQDDDWLSTRTASGVLTKGVPLKGCNGPEGIVGFTHGEYFATIAVTGDITAAGGATISRQRLPLGIGWTASSCTFDGNYYYIVGYRAQSAAHGFVKSSCRLWLWDGHSDNPNFIYEIPDNYVSLIHNADGLMRIFTTGKNNFTRVFHFTGGQIGEPAFEYSQGGIGESPRHGSADLFQGMLHFAMNGVSYRIATLESQGNGRDAFNVRCHPNTTSASVSDVGMVKDLQGNGFYIGVKTGVSTWKIMQWSVNSYFPGAVLRSGLKRVPDRSETDTMRLRFSQFGSGASLTVKLYPAFDSGSSPIFTRQFTNATLGAITSLTFPLTLTDVSSLWMEYTFDHGSSSDTAAIVQSAELDYLADDESSI